MYRLIIDGSKIEDIKEVHDIFCKELNFDDYYGYNLDALWDMLNELDDNCLISIINSEYLEYRLEDDYANFINLLVDAQNEIEDLFVRVDSYYLQDFSDEYKEDEELLVIYDEKNLLRYRLNEYALVIEENTFEGQDYNKILNYLRQMFPLVEKIVAKENLELDFLEKTEYKIYNVI